MKSNYNKPVPPDRNILPVVPEDHDPLIENLSVSSLSLYDSFLEFDPELDLNLLTQHLQTSPPILHLHPKSVFHSTHSKGPYVEAF